MPDELGDLIQEAGRRGLLDKDPELKGLVQEAQKRHLFTPPSSAAAGQDQGSTLLGRSPLPPAPSAATSPSRQNGTAKSSTTSTPNLKNLPKDIEPSIQAGTSVISRFAPKGATGKRVISGTIGPPPTTPEPNMFQKGLDALGNVLSYPKGLLTSGASYVHQALGTDRLIPKTYQTPDEIRRDKANLERIRKMSPFQRAAALRGENPLDPLMGRPSAQSIRGDIDARMLGPLAGAAKAAGDIGTDPLSYGALGVLGKALPATGRAALSGAFAAQMGASGAQKLTHAAKTGDQSLAIEGLVDIGMGTIAGRHGAGEFKAGRAAKAQAKTAADAAANSNRPLTAEEQARRDELIGQVNQGATNAAQPSAFVSKPKPAKPAGHSNVKVTLNSVIVPDGKGGTTELPLPADAADRTEFIQSLRAHFDTPQKAGPSFSKQGKVQTTRPTAAIKPAALKPEPTEQEIAAAEYKRVKLATNNELSAVQAATKAVNLYRARKGQAATVQEQPVAAPPAQTAAAPAAKPTQLYHASAKAGEPTIRTDEMAKRGLGEPDGVYYSDSPEEAARSAGLATGKQFITKGTPPKNPLVTTQADMDAMQLRLMKENGLGDSEDALNDPAVARKAAVLLTDHIRQQGYDGVRIQGDEHNEPRTVKFASTSPARRPKTPTPPVAPEAPIGTFAANVEPVRAMPAHEPTPAAQAKAIPPDTVKALSEIPVDNSYDSQRHALTMRHLADSGLPLYKSVEDVPDKENLVYHGTDTDKIPSIVSTDVRGLMSKYEDAKDRNHGDIIFVYKPAPGGLERSGNLMVSDAETLKPGKPIAAIVNKQNLGKLEYQERRLAERNKESAVQKQGSGAQVLQPERPTMELPGVGKGNKPEVTARKSEAQAQKEIGPRYFDSFKDKSGAIDMGKAADSLAAEVETHLASGGRATLVSDGKHVSIVGVSKGMMQDAKGQRWGVLSIAADNNGTNKVILDKPEASQEVGPASTKAAAKKDATVASFGDWVDSQPKGKVYTKGSDLYQAYKAENPKTTREGFGKMLLDLHASGSHEVVGPTGNFPKLQEFSATDSAGKPVRIAGIRRAVDQSKPYLALPASEASSLSANMDKEHPHPLSGKLEGKGLHDNSPVALTAEEVSSLRDYVKKNKLDPRNFPVLHGKGEQGLHAGVPLGEMAKWVQHVSHGGRYRQSYEFDKGLGDDVNRVAGSSNAGKVYGLLADRDIARALPTQDLKDRFDKLTISLNLHASGAGTHPQAMSVADTHRELSDPHILAAALVWKQHADTLGGIRADATPGMSGLHIIGDLFRTLRARTFEGGNAAPEPINIGTPATVVGKYKIKPSQFARQRKGTAEEYRTGIDDYFSQMFSESMRKANLRSLYNNLQNTRDSAGNPIAVPPNRYGAGPATISYIKPGSTAPKEYDAVPVEFEISDRPGERAAKSKLYVPKEMAGDINDVLASNQMLPRLNEGLRGFQKIIVGTQLLAPQDMLRHVWRVTSIVSHVPDAKASPLRRVVEALAPTGGILPKWSRLYDIGNNDMSTPENQQIYKQLADANADSNRAFSDYMTNTIPGISKAQHFVHDFLFSAPEGKGLTGFDIRARVFMEKMRRAVEGNEDPKRMRDFANQLGQYTAKPDTMVEMARVLNPYAATSLGMRPAEVRHLIGDPGFDTSTMTAQQRLALKSETLFRGSIQFFGTYLLLNKALSGHYPWQNAAGHNLEIDTGQKDKDGAIVYVKPDIPGLGDPALTRGLRETGAKGILAAAKRGSAEEAVNSEKADQINNILFDTFRSPALDTLSGLTTGTVPYASYDRNTHRFTWTLPVAKLIKKDKAEKGLLGKLPGIPAPKKEGPDPKQWREQELTNVKAAVQNLNPVLGEGLSHIPGYGENRFLRQEMQKPLWWWVQRFESIEGPILKKGAKPKEQKSLLGKPG